MAINKVEYGNETLIDLTNDTVTEDNVLEGATFHSADGEERTGKVVVADVIDNLTSESSEDALSANQGRILNENKLDIDLENIDEVGIERIKEIAGESSVPENIVLHSPSEEEVEVPPIDADMLGGELPEHYENELYLANDSTPSTPSPRDADMLGGQLPSYYAKASDLIDLSKIITMMNPDRIANIAISKATDGRIGIWFYENQAHTTWYTLWIGTTSKSLYLQYYDGSSWTVIWNANVN